jgi:hypothetical protein
MPVPSPAGAPTPSTNPAPEGGEVLAAGRARGPAAKSRNQPQAIDRTGVSDASKGTLRRASPALDRALNARNAVDRGGHACAAPQIGRRPFHTKRHIATRSRWLKLFPLQQEGTTRVTG